MSDETITLETIENETALIPSFIADTIVSEAQCFFNHTNRTEFNKNRKKLIEKLVSRLVRLVNINPKFKKQVYGKNGREWSYTWMRHWLASDLITIYKIDSSIIPKDFKGFSN